MLTIHLYRQEVPIHWSRLHPWPYLDWHRGFHQNAPNSHHPPRISPLRPQVRQIREETQESCCTRFASFPCWGGWPSYRWTMQTFEQDRMCQSHSTLSNFIMQIFQHYLREHVLTLLPNRSDSMFSVCFPELERLLSSSPSSRRFSSGIWAACGFLGRRVRRLWSYEY